MSVNVKRQKKKSQPPEDQNLLSNVIITFWKPGPHKVFSLVVRIGPAGRIMHQLFTASGQQRSEVIRSAPKIRGYQIRSRSLPLSEGCENCMRSSKAPVSSSDVIIKNKRD